MKSLRSCFGAAVSAVLVAFPCPAFSGEGPAAQHFHSAVEPVLTRYCSDCHLDGMHRGNVAFDQLGSGDEIAANQDLWLKVLKNLRAGLMPPGKKPRPGTAERKQLEDWIKHDAFRIDPNNVDPGRVTVRRLNRVEYRNTIKDLLGVDFDTENEFPQDDSGYGFDNI